jgi:hypothetical protein
LTLIQRRWKFVDRFVGLRLFPVRQFPSRGLFVAFTIPGIHGVVDIFDMTGNLLKNLTSASELKAPLGISACARAIGLVSDAVLVGNLHDGRINAFNATTGSFIGSLTTPQEK